jgi:hypothetical protein
MIDPSVIGPPPNDSQLQREAGQAAILSRFSPGFGHSKERAALC